MVEAPHASKALDSPSRCASPLITREPKETGAMLQIRNRRDARRQCAVAMSVKRHREVEPTIWPLFKIFKAHQWVKGARALADLRGICD